MFFSFGKKKSFFSSNLIKCFTNDEIFDFDEIFNFFFPFLLIIFYLKI